MRMTEALGGMVSPEEITRLQSAFDRLDYDAGYEDAVASGALSITKRTSGLFVDGTKAYTLANGTYAGQRKTIICTSVNGSPAGTVTPATLANGDTLAFNAVNDCVELVWSGSTWQVCALNSVTIA